MSELYDTDDPSLENFEAESEFLMEHDFGDGEEVEIVTKCNACFGTGMDRYLDSDCLVCYGEGYF